MIRSFFTILFLLVILPMYAVAAEKAITIEVTGEAFGSDLEAPRELFERAKADAQRIAIEQAVGTFVRSHTVVSNGQLAEEMTHARVRGKIERVVVLSQERDNLDPHHYLVRLRATIEPVLVDKSESIIIQAALSRSRLREGDDVRFQYQVSRNSHVYIFVIGADNSVTQLLPNSELRDNLTTAKRVFHFPPDGSDIRLTAQLLPESRRSGADERIKIIATKKEEPLLQGSFKEGFKVYDGKSTGLVSDLLKHLAQLDPADWGETTLTYRIDP
jgi:hypothetical protein